MATGSRAFYQYETSPRKLEPEYKPNKRKNDKKLKTQKNKTQLKKSNLQIKREKEMAERK